MQVKESMVCPICKGKHFEVKREATYVYSYKLDTPEIIDYTNETESLPFLFDNRKQTDSKQYVQCTQCNKKFPCELESDSNGIKFIILQKAIRSEQATKPEFLG